MPPPANHKPTTMPNASFPPLLLITNSPVTLFRSSYASGGRRSAQKESRLLSNWKVCEAKRPNRVNRNSSKGKRASKELNASPEALPSRSSSSLSRITFLTSCQGVRPPSFQSDPGCCPPGAQSMTWEMPGKFSEQILTHVEAETAVRKLFVLKAFSALDLSSCS